MLGISTRTGALRARHISPEYGPPFNGVNRALHIAGSRLCAFAKASCFNFTLRKLNERRIAVPAARLRFAGDSLESEAANLNPKLGRLIRFYGAPSLAARATCADNRHEANWLHEDVLAIRCASTQR